MELTILLSELNGLQGRELGTASDKHPIEDQGSDTTTMVYLS